MSAIAVRHGETILAMHCPDLCRLAVAPVTALPLHVIDIIYPVVAQCVNPRFIFGWLCSGSGGPALSG